jgi:hypothetical protein
MSCIAYADDVPARLTPQDVSTILKERGASGTIVFLSKSGQWASSVLPGIESGEPAWLQVARALHKGADAGGSEDLEDAMLLAALKVPYSVLPILKEFWWKGLGSTCVFGYDSELPGGVATYVNNLKTALNKQPPGDASQKLHDECLHGIEATLKDVRENDHQGQ